ncbi:ribonuclease H-like domain-containing protein [Neobacillus sp. YIM B06451]|uniref:ribonuclease H-like domain-containing protein n=1 Tax=Neobacillus sp. YIM B06451 TaxID=3070994 RepID=UPI00292D83E5|nr:ribonuclease H-like domain-containing protein [Neobacillus sp. YIM B06451]
MSLKNKLNRLKPHLSTGNEPLRQIEEQKGPAHEVPFKDDWAKAGVCTYHFDGQYCLIKEVAYPLSHQHGKYRFSDFIKATAIWEKTGIEHPLSSAGHSPGELFFFDTETTGLGGGTGNTIFLLGYAYVKGNSLLLRQHILPNPGAEVPLYQSFLENINYRTLVTYNGKSFDWPQVKTRHTLVRDHVPKLPQFGHFDLYHAARRLWKHRLDRMKLSVVEKEVLGVERVDDIPGFLAPMIYFDFVESGRLEGMLGIMKHNELDILSLVTLYAHLTFQICGVDEDRTNREAFEVGKWFSSVGNHGEAVKAFTELIDGKGEEADRSRLALAYALKKERNWEGALELFSSLANSADRSLAIEGCIEVAKILEHRDKNFEKGLEFCRKAISLFEVEEIRLSTGKASIGELVHREARLVGKCGLGKRSSNV